MKVENFTLEKLIPYSSNNRFHGDEQVERIAKSISEFGFNQPIVIDEDNVILVGHGRFEAAKKLKLEEVPVLKVLGLDDTKKRAYRILDNKLQNDSTWNFENLESEINFLTENDFDIDSWGLDDFDKFFGDEVDGDPNKEYKDMPEYVSEDETAIQKIIVNFKNREDVRNFAKLVEQENITDKTKSLWYPCVERKKRKTTSFKDENDS